MRAVKQLFWIVVVSILCSFNSVTAKDSNSEPLSAIWPHPNTLRLNSLFNLPNYKDVPEVSFTQMVTMRKLPSGSMYTIYHGPQRLIIKLARKRIRRLQRKHEGPILNYLPDHEVSRIALRRAEQWSNLDWNGNWWSRDWFDSLPSEKGGAPDVPFFNVVGNNIKWTLGPLTFSNTLSVKLDYFAILRVNTDPEPQINPDRLPASNPQTPITVDIEPGFSDILDYSNKIDFEVKPIIRIGIPRSGNLLSFLRKIALRAEASLTYRGVPIINAHVELKYDPEGEVSLTADIAFVKW